MGISRDAVWSALEHVIDPELRRPVTDLDMVREIRIGGGRVDVRLALTVAGCPLRASFQEQVATTVGAVSGGAWECSTPTSMDTRSRTCSGSRRSRWWSTG